MGPNSLRFWTLWAITVCTPVCQSFFGGGRLITNYTRPGEWNKTKLGWPFPAHCSLCLCAGSDLAKIPTDPCRQQNLTNHIINKQPETRPTHSKTTNLVMKTHSHSSFSHWFTNLHNNTVQDLIFTAFSLLYFTCALSTICGASWLVGLHGSKFIQKERNWSF